MNKLTGSPISMTDERLRNLAILSIEKSVLTSGAYIRGHSGVRQGQGAWSKGIGKEKEGDITAEGILLQCGPDVMGSLVEEADGWEYTFSIYFCMTLVTTIGYGHVAPQTVGGRYFCIFYSLIGIPVTGMLLAAVGDGFSAVMIKFFDEGKEKLPAKYKDYGVAIATVSRDPEFIRNHSRMAMGMMMSMGSAFGGAGGSSNGLLPGPMSPAMSGIGAAFGKAGGGQGAGLAGLFNIAASANPNDKTIDDVLNSTVEGSGGTTVAELLIAVEHAKEELNLPDIGEEDDELLRSSSPISMVLLKK
ncbi:unnamed protein product [Cyprideis torosa]|uniref:Potassium channel domain-containing protein n=1 Tax=Cyprideis torosa TaxID=163714 RepID=A0A7R8WEK1_9CRUS|nr:unnamed protein product [Cyprideis torosa]CAG0889913.1 unnamed protein product [Cyprideis torosa]